MDLAELPSSEFRRHPWEISRWSFFARVLRARGVFERPARVLDARRVLERPGLFLRKDDDLAGALCESLEHWLWLSPAGAVAPIPSGSV